ncbi:unnamed protein product [Boreogadus saida]
MVLLPLKTPLPHPNLNTPLSYRGPFSQRSPPPRGDESVLTLRTGLLPSDPGHQGGGPTCTGGLSVIIFIFVIFSTRGGINGPSSISALGLPGPQTVENTPPPPSRPPPFNPGDELLSNNLLPEHNNICDVMEGRHGDLDEAQHSDEQTTVDIHRLVVAGAMARVVSICAGMMLRTQNP